MVNVAVGNYHTYYLTEIVTKLSSSCVGNRIEKNRYFSTEMEIKFQEAFHNEVKKMVSDHPGGECFVIYSELYMICKPRSGTSADVIFWLS